MKKRKSKKRMLLGFALLYSFVMVFGSTFSWMTSSSSVKNEAETGALHVIIQEVFTPNLTWTAGSTSECEITVKNLGTIPAVVRVTLTENFLSFQFDNKDQNGNLVTTSDAATIDFDDTETWEKDGIYYDAETNLSYIGAIRDTNSTVFDNAARRLLGRPFKYIMIDQPKVKNVDANDKSGYWVYEDGYFYYSEILLPGETSTPLTTSLKITDDLPHSYKFSLYKMDMDMDALGAMDGVLVMWTTDDNTLDDTKEVYGLLNQKLSAY